MDGKPRLLAQVREQIRFKHYPMRAEQVYCPCQFVGDSIGA